MSAAMEWSFSEGGKENTQRRRERRVLLVINPFQRAGERVSGDGKEFQVRSERGLGSVMWGLDSRGQERPGSSGSGRMDISRSKGHDGLRPGGHKADNEESAGRALEFSPGVVSQRAGPSVGHRLMVAVLRGHTVK